MKGRKAVPLVRGPVTSLGCCNWIECGTKGQVSIDGPAAARASLSMPCFACSASHHTYGRHLLQSPACLSQQTIANYYATRAPAFMDDAYIIGVWPG